MQYEKAEQLGVAVWDYDSNGKRVKVQEAIVQQRIQEAERSLLRRSRCTNRRSPTTSRVTTSMIVLP